LHPHAQRCLFKDLEKITSPVLISTHSPEIVECCDPLGLIKFSLNFQNEISAHQLNPSKFTREDLKLLERMMRSGRADAFFAKSLIIVEGASETIALPAFADFLAKNLDREGVSVVPADSNAFSFIMNSCSKANFDIPAVVMFDTDACTHNTLVNEAFKSGLIDKNKRDSYSNETEQNRRILLESLGWIPVVEAFEEEIGNSGYLSLMLVVIEKEGMTSSLDRYLIDKSLSKDARGVSKFIKSKGGKSLKIPIATAVANAVQTVGHVPPCFERAITQAIQLASGNPTTP
jgi:predicted ATP-dependent endonuclease of OLD family